MKVLDELKLDLLDLLEIDQKAFRLLNWEGGFEDYIEMARKNPSITASAFRRLHEAIMAYGTKEYVHFGKKITRYGAFTDPSVAKALSDIGAADDDTVFGLDLPIMRFMRILEGAAKMQGPHKRLILFIGPVGSAKSTIVRRMKKILEQFTRTDKGAIYTLKWIAQDEKMRKIIGGEEYECPIHEDPLNIVPIESQSKLLDYLGEDVSIRATPCPFCKKVINEGLKVYGGSWSLLIKSAVRIKRFVFSEHDRVGIGTFQPKDEKNQDSTELTGDINFRALSKYGVDSDPRAFCFDGEFFVANRGIIEFIEILKLDRAFLYDLLTGSQEHKVKPKKFQQVDIDEVIIGHTNEPEYRKLVQDEFMEALKDRTLEVTVPYIIILSEEEKIYAKKFDREKLKKQGKHIAPHTLEMASMWSVLTRLVEPSKAHLSLIQKLKLYNGQTLPGFTEDNIKELLKDGKERQEGKSGISVRYVEDKISNALVNPECGNCINPFKVLMELEGGLPYHSLISTDDIRKKFKTLLEIVRGEFEEAVKEEVQEAISADEEGLSNLCKNYIANLKAYTQKEKIKNKYTGKEEEADERLMRSVEEKIEIPDSRKDDFRREIMNYIGSLALEGKTFNHKSNERLNKAFRKKLFEEKKDTLQRFTTALGGIMDKETQEKMGIVTATLVRRYGYCEICARDTLNYVASIFARGDIKDKNR